jgi:hypothetical protein
LSARLTGSEKRVGELEPEVEKERRGRLSLEALHEESQNEIRCLRESLVGRRDSAT